MRPVVHRRSQLACACCVCVCVCVRVAGGFAWAGGSPAQPLPGSPTASAHPIFILKYGTVHTARNPSSFIAGALLQPCIPARGGVMGNGHKRPITASGVYEQQVQGKPEARGS